MKIIAHRGYSLKYKDNSIESIKGAIDREYDGVEIDVQLCRTGELVLYHDIYIEKEFVCEMSLEYLRSLGVCSLQDVYDNVPEIRQTLLLIDIKGSSLKTVDALKTFYMFKPTKHVIFCSFNRKIIYNLPKSFQRGSSFETTFHEKEYEYVTSDIQAVVLHWTCLDDKFINYCKKNDINVFTYTHKDEKELEYMNRYDVDGIITNGF